MEKRNLRLLILADSPNDAESYAVLFRNAGYVTRVHRITSQEDAELVLSEKWDLIIALPNCENLAPEDLLALLTAQAVDIPYIQLVNPEVLQDEQQVISFLKQGALDVLPVAVETEHLLLIAERELTNLMERRSLEKVQQTLVEYERRCQLLLDSSMDAIAYIHEGMHIYLNQAYVDLFGYKDKLDMEGLPIIDLVSANDPNDLKELFKHRVESFLACRGVRADGSTFPILITTYPISYDDEECMQVIIREETAVNNSDALAEKIREISNLDALTGFYNRVYLSELVDKAMSQFKIADTQSVLMYIKIDNLDGTISQVGIAGCDSLLVGFAQLLKDHFQQGESLARLSDDVFVVLVSGTTANELVDSIKELQDKINKAIFDINNFSIQITVSIGIADFDKAVANAQEILDRAHICVDTIKNGNGIKVYDPAEALAAAAIQGDMLATLQQTLQQKSLKLLYQPIVSLRGKSYEFYEARLRMLDAKGKELPLTELLKVATASGMAEQIDRWVIVNALKEVARMRALGHNPRVFAQIGSDALKNEELLDWLKKLFEATKLPPECLLIEFTESDAATYLKQAQYLIKGLQEINCQVVVSDFGKDANSLLTLAHLPVSLVKVAPSLVQALRKDEGVKALTEMLVKLRELKFKNIVPFVETASTLSVLWQAGADYIQGYYLQRPTPTMSYDFSSEQ